MTAELRVDLEPRPIVAEDRQRPGVVREDGEGRGAIDAERIALLDERREPLIEPGRDRRTAQPVDRDMAELVTEDRRPAGVEDALAVDRDRVDARERHATGLPREQRGRIGRESELTLQCGREGLP